MKRWHEEYSISHKNWKTHFLFHVESNLRDPRRIGKDPYQVDCVCDQQKGRYRKRDGYDCGNTQCYLCHYDKYPKRHETRQEKKSKLKFKEGMDQI